METQTNHGYGNIQYQLFVIAGTKNCPAAVKLPIDQISDDKLESMISAARLENGDESNYVSVLQAEHYRRITGSSALLSTVVSGIIKVNGFMRFMLTSGSGSNAPSTARVGEVLIEYTDTVSL